MTLDVTFKELLNDLQKVFLHTKKMPEDLLILVSKQTSKVLKPAQGVTKTKKF